MRILDTWVHEQDVRTAVSQPGGRTTGPARLTLQQMLRGLPPMWARAMSAPEGSTLRVRVTGDLSADITVIAGADGMGAVHDTVELATVSLSADWSDFSRLCSGRVDPEDPALRGRIELAGDPALTLALLPALTMTP
jgi:predicted lipid carrier protein YhbT